MTDETTSETTEAPEPNEEDAYAAGFEQADAVFTERAADEPAEQNDEPEQPVEPVEAQPDDETQQEAPAEPQPTPQIWDGLADDKKQQLQQIVMEAAKREHMFQSEQARAIGQQQRADKLQAELEALKANSQPESVPADEQADEELENAYPEVAAAMRAMRAENAKLREEIQTRLTPVEEQSQVSAARAAEDALTEMHSDWKQIVNSPSFLTAISAAPKMFRDAFARNAKLITDAEDAATVIDYYKTHNGYTPAVQPNPQQTTASQVKQQRQARNQAAAAPNVRSEPTKPDVATEQDEYSAGFSQADRMFGRGRGQI